MAKMDRRIFVKTLGSASALSFLPVAYPSNWSNEQISSPRPNKAQLAWQNAELGVVFHYDLHVFDNKKYGQGNNRIDPIPDYNIFNPEQLDTDQWIKAAKAMSATFAILTVTHETGFALYQSDVNPYCLKAVKWRDGKGDIVHDFVTSCRKYGLKPALYMGIRWNSFYGVHDFEVNGEGDFKKNRQRHYNKMVEGMLKEVCTRYGELFEIWFDGGASSPEKGAPDVLPIVKKYQPNALFYHNDQLAEARWGGSESGTVGYPCWSTFLFKSTGAGESAQKQIYDNNFAMLKHGTPDGKYWMPAMSDAPLRGYNGRHEWFWEPGDDDHVFPLENLMEMYYKSVGRNSTLIMGITPDPTGLVPEGDARRMKEWGDEIKRRFSKPLAETSGEGQELLLQFSKAQMVNHVIVREDIARGERIRRYSMEGRSPDGQWRKICEGESVGNKRIEQFESRKLTEIRLTITEQTETPLIRLMSAFYVI